MGMTLVYRLLADLVVTVHFAYVAFVVWGLLLTLVGAVMQWSWVRNIWFRAIHLLSICIVVVEAWCGIVCPLTVWENQLRRLAGQSTYSGGFIAETLHDWLFYEADPWVFTLGYSVFGFVVVATLLAVPPRLPSKRGDGSE